MDHIERKKFKRETYITKDSWAKKDENGRWVSKGKIKVKATNKGTGAEIQKKRQARDESLRREAGQVSEFCHENTLSKPFGKSKNKTAKLEPSKELTKTILEKDKKRRKNKRKIENKRDNISELRIQILERDKHMCRYCGSKIGPFEIDHVIPWSKGGGDREDNLVTACRLCNRRKGANIWIPSNQDLL